MSNLRDKFINTMDEMNKRVFERQEVVEILVTGLLSDTNVFLLGEPGVAKSYTVNLFTKSIKDVQPGEVFSKLMTRYTSPSEVFGALDMEALKKSIHRHSIDYRSLAMAKIAWLDETFKANSSILNSLLTALNERTFNNDVVIELPLLLAIGASNELPQGEELNALYDRFGLRYQVLPLRTAAAQAAMLKGEHDDEPMPTLLSWDDIEQARGEVRSVTITDEIIDTLISMKSKLGAEGLYPSDRRIKSMLPVIQATAWLRDADTAEIEDMRNLVHMLWDDPKDRPTADQVVLKLASPLDAEAVEIGRELDSLHSEVQDIIQNSDNAVARRQSGLTVYGKIQSAHAEVKALKKKAAGRPSARIDAVVEQTKSLQKLILNSVIGVESDDDDDGSEDSE